MSYELAGTASSIIPFEEEDPDTCELKVGDRVQYLFNGVPYRALSSGELVQGHVTRIIQGQYALMYRIDYGRQGLHDHKRSILRKLSGPTEVKTKSVKKQRHSLTSFINKVEKDYA